MIKTDYRTVSTYLDDYCEMLSHSNETLEFRRNEKDMVLLSLDTYKEMEKAIKNTEYLSDIKQAFEQLGSGHRTVHELIED